MLDGQAITDRIKEMNALRYKRGDKHPSNAGLFFFRYRDDEEVWVTSERLEVIEGQRIKANAKYRTTPHAKKYMKRYFESYNKLPKQKAYHSAYYKRADVRAKLQEKRNSNPIAIAKREARLAWRKERSDYRASDTFKAILKERNKRTYLKRTASGKNAKFYRDKRRTNVQYRLACNMRRLITYALTRNAGALRAARTFDLIGCTVSALRIHIESQFTEQMTWANYGSVWHVDHRLPLSLFNLTDAKQQRIAFHFENLRPLLAAENIKKSDRVTVDGKEVRGRNINKIIPFKAA